MIYLALAVGEVLLAVLYGFLLHSIVPMPVYSATTFCVPIIILLFCQRRDEKPFLRKLANVLVPSLLLAAMSVMVFTYGNELTGDFLGEHEVTVQEVSYRGSGAAYFTDTNGEKARVDLRDGRLFITDDEDLVEVGDTITVEEYIGFFGEKYYVLIGDK